MSRQPQIEQSTGRESATGARGSILIERLFGWHEQRRARLRAEHRTGELDQLERDWETCPLVREADRRRADPSPHRHPEVEHRVGMGVSARVTPAPHKTSQRPATLTGHAAVFQPASAVIPIAPGITIVEEIQRGAFREVLAKKPDTFFLYMHDDTSVLPLARTLNGSLRLYEDNVGLLFYADMMERDSLTTALLRRVREGILTKMSFSFSIRDDPDSEEFVLGTSTRPTRRIIKKISRLWDISLVTFPAYPATDVSILAQDQGTQRDIVHEPSAKERLSLLYARDPVARIESDIREAQIASVERKLGLRKN